MQPEWRRALIEQQLIVGRRSVERREHRTSRSKSDWFGKSRIDSDR
jgi:hypothetical protein